MNETRRDIYFLPWFEHNYAKINTKEVNTSSDSLIKLQTNEIIHKEYPHNTSISLTHKESQLVAFPLKKASISNDNIIQQNNFTNTCIKPLNKKLERIENQEKEMKRPLLYETPPNS
jgi:hypothetical protein